MTASKLLLFVVSFLIVLLIQVIGIPILLTKLGVQQVDIAKQLPSSISSVISAAIALYALFKGMELEKSRWQASVNRDGWNIVLCIYVQNLSSRQRLQIIESEVLGFSKDVDGSAMEVVVAANSSADLRLQFSPANADDGYLKTLTHPKTLTGEIRYKYEGSGRISKKRFALRNPFFVPLKGLSR